MICWNPIHYSVHPGEVMVVFHREENHLADHLNCSVGACFSEWGEMSEQNRLLKLMSEVWHIACRDGVPLKNLHEALTVIPEYEVSIWNGESFFDF